MKTRITTMPSTVQPLTQSPDLDLVPSRGKGMPRVNAEYFANEAMQVHK
jgi:hypothetical protein